MNGGFCRLVKINLVFLNDTAFIFSKSRFDCAGPAELSVCQKLRTDRQTDGFSALCSRCIENIMYTHILNTTLPTIHGFKFVYVTSHSSISIHCGLNFILLQSCECVVQSCQYVVCYYSKS